MFTRTAIAAAAALALAAGPAGAAASACVWWPAPHHHTIAHHPAPHHKPKHKPGASHKPAPKHKPSKHVTHKPTAKPKPVPTKKPTLKPKPAPAKKPVPTPPVPAKKPTPTKPRPTNPSTPPVVVPVPTNPSMPDPTPAPTTPTTPTPTTPTQTKYVNLGDSYSAGYGLSPLAANAPQVCSQASANHAHVLAAALKYALTDVSCTGAATKDFTTAQYDGVPPQLSALTQDTRLVTMMIGGNDSGLFTNVVQTCGVAGYQAQGKGSPCMDANKDSFTNTIRNTTYPALVQAFKAVRGAAPNAKVAVVGYPRLLPESGGCFSNMPIAEGDIAYVNNIQVTLNDAVQRAAVATGVTYVDAYTPSQGHDACQAEGTRWVEPILNNTGGGRAHPNTLGEQAIAHLERQALGLG